MKPFRLMPRIWGGTHMSIPGLYNAMNIVGSGEENYPGTLIEIDADTNNVNLFTLASSPANAGTWSFLIHPGVIIGSTSTSTPSLRTGSFVAGSEIYLFNKGSIYGKGGKGGNGGDGGKAIALNGKSLTWIDGNDSDHVKGTVS